MTYQGPAVAAASHTARPWHTAGYVLIGAGAVLIAMALLTVVAPRLRARRRKAKARPPRPEELRTALRSAETDRLLRIAAVFRPYAVEVGRESVLIRLAGIKVATPAPPWTGSDDERVWTAPRDRLDREAESPGHSFLALGLGETGPVFVDPAHSPGLIGIGGENQATEVLAELLRGQAEAVGAEVRIVAGKPEGAQWRWRLAADGLLDTGVLGVQAQTRELASALRPDPEIDPDEAVARRAPEQSQNPAEAQTGIEVGGTLLDRLAPPVESAATQRADTGSLVDRLDPAPTAEPAPGAGSLLDRLPPADGFATSKASVPAEDPTTAKALALTRPVQPGPRRATDVDLDLDAVSAAEQE